MSPHQVRVRAYEVSVEKRCPEAEEDPGVETFPVSVEADTVVLYIPHQGKPA